MKLALLNQSSAPPDQMAKVAAALDVYLKRDVCPAWERAPIDVVWMPGVAVAPDGFFALVAMETPDEPGMLGYHTTDPRGVPYGRAFLGIVPGRQVLRDQRGMGASLAGVLSHEAAELAMDVFAGFWSDGPVKGPDGKSYDQVALEISDPVQESAYAITLDDGTQVDASNFVLPRYFDGEATTGPFDHLGVLTAPLTVAAGGYAVVRSSTNESQVAARLLHAVEPSSWRGQMNGGAHSRSFRRLSER